jgi:hypothetical protein
VVSGDSCGQWGFLRSVARGQWRFLRPVEIPVASGLAPRWGAKRPQYTRRAVSGRPCRQVLGPLRAPTRGKPARHKKPTDLKMPADHKKPINLKKPADHKKPINLKKPADLKKPTNLKMPADLKMPTGSEKLASHSKPRPTDTGSPQLKTPFPARRARSWAASKLCNGPFGTIAVGLMVRWLA